MLAGLGKYYVLRSYWWMFLPGLVLIPIFLLYNTIADRLLERFQPAGPRDRSSFAVMAKVGEAR
jgi:ABC-type dipeptide/oligopeptide/nickel transport system permease subunit